MKISDLFKINVQKKETYNKYILHLECKVKHFDITMEETKSLIDEYLLLLKKFPKDLSVYIDLRSIETVSPKCVWEGISECTAHDSEFAETIKQEAIIINNQKIIWIVNNVLKIHKPIFRFKLTNNEEDALKFLSAGMHNNYAFE